MAEVMAGVVAGVMAEVMAGVVAEVMAGVMAEVAARPVVGASTATPPHTTAMAATTVAPTPRRAL
jgi:hypothetical protein